METAALPMTAKSWHAASMMMTASLTTIFLLILARQILDADGWDWRVTAVLRMTM